ncbi:MAG: Fe-S-containing protein [Helicobacteraceae bacterium]|jgi:uncharacterized membrane protein|nr:Fe-S-containing protein [Helicobacteraceae bacterium]
MLHYLINVINALFFTLVLIGILIGGFASNDQTRVKSASIAALLGFIVALAAAILDYNAKLIAREYYNLIVLIPLIATQIVFAFFVFCLPRSEAAAFVVRALAPLMLFLLLAYGLVDIFLYPSEFSVGMDNIYNQDFALKWFGYILALITLLILYYSVYRVSLGASKKIFLPLTGAILFLVVVHELLSVIYALTARSMIPRYDPLIEAVFFVSDRIDILFYIACVLTALVAATLYIFESRKIFVAPQDGYSRRDRLFSADTSRIVSAPNPAVRRKLLAESRSKRRFYILTALSLFAAALFARGGSWLADRGAEISPPIEVQAEEGVIVLALTEFDDGRLKRYLYRTPSGAEVRFIVIKKDRGGYGIGLDACEICGVSGYYEQDDKIICSRCGVAINKATIGFRGGCNPIPFAYEITNSALRILAATLESEEGRFR